MDSVFFYIGVILADIGPVAIVYAFSWFIVKRFKAERKYSLTFVLTFLILLIIELYLQVKVYNFISSSLDLLIVAGVSFRLRDKELPVESETNE